jgi:hypothetical protein
MRRLIGIVLAFSLALLGYGIGAAPAAQAYCPNEYSIFVRSTSTAANTNGTQSNLTWFDRDLGSDCPGIAVSTANVNKGDYGTSDWGTWIEVGWRKHSDCGGNGAGMYCWFTEKGVSFTVQQETEYDIATPTIGSHDVYRIHNTPESNGQTDWPMQVDANLDGSFLTLDTYNTLWHTGVAFGETGALGASVGMHDEQRALRWKNSNDTWNPWPNNDCSLDTSASWDWDRVSSNEHNVVQNGSNC